MCCFYYYLYFCFCQEVSWSSFFLFPLLFWWVSLLILCDSRQYRSVSWSCEELNLSLFFFFWSFLNFWLKNLDFLARMTTPLLSHYLDCNFTVRVCFSKLVHSGTKKMLYFTQNLIYIWIMLIAPSQNNRK